MHTSCPLSIEWASVWPLTPSTLTPLPVPHVQLRYLKLFIKALHPKHGEIPSRNIYAVSVLCSLTVWTAKGEHLAISFNLKNKKQKPTLYLLSSHSDRQKSRHVQTEFRKSTQLPANLPIQTTTIQTGQRCVFCFVPLTSTPSNPPFGQRVWGAGRRPRIKVQTINPCYQKALEELYSSWGQTIISQTLHTYGLMRSSTSLHSASPSSASYRV